MVCFGCLLFTLFMRFVVFFCALISARSVYLRNSESVFSIICCAMLHCPVRLVTREKSNTHHAQRA